MDIIARLIIAAYQSMWIFLMFAGLLGLPLVVFHALASLTELYRRDYDLWSITPVFSWIRYLVAFVYGILMPCIYFICVRTKRGFGPFQLGAETNQIWCIVVGIACVAWLLYQMLRGLLNGRGWRITPGCASLLFAGAGMLLAWRYQMLTFVPLMAGMNESLYGGVERYFHILLPLTAFVSATAVYTLAFVEALARTRRRETPRSIGVWRNRLAQAATAGVLLLLFSPFLLSIPREAPRATLGLIRENEESIKTIAQDFRIDPRLLAGVIYVARTRDHPRWTGGAIEELGLAMWRTEPWSFASPGGGDIASDLINPSVGLCQMKMTTSLGVSRLGYANPYASHSSGFLTGSPEPQMTRHLDRLKDVDDYVPYKSATNPQQAFDDPEISLIMAAFYMHIICQQWEETNPAWSIRDRPEIVATLYNIGIERSFPKRDPKPNDFGRRVLKIYDNPRLAEALGLKQTLEDAE